MAELESKLTNFRKLLEFVKPYQRRLFGALIITVLLTGVSMTPPLIMKFIVDDIIVGGRWDLLEIVLLISVTIPVMASGLRVLNTYAISVISHRLIMDIRERMFDHLLKLPLQFYDHMGTGKIMSRIMSDVATVRSMVTMRMLSVVTDFVSFWFAIGMCISLNWKLGALLIILLPLYLFNYFGWRGGIRSSIRAWRAKMDRVSVGLHERLSGVQLVKAYGKERRENRAFANETRDTFDQAMQTATYRAGYESGVWAVSGIRNTTVFCLGCYFVVEGEMTYGGVMAFLSYAMRVFQPVLNLTQEALRFEQMMISVDRIFEVLDHGIEIKDKPDSVELDRIKGRVVFEDVWFEYEEGEKVIRGVNLEVKPGEMVALVGHTGCGKTTLTSLLMRFFDPKQGRIMIDGYDLRDVKVGSLRKQIGQVLQDSVMFNSSIRDNLVYGNPDATEADIVAAARVGEIHEFIARTADGYDTQLGDEGIKLSVGEKQRLSIARAVLTNPSVLILDEATSSLDSLSEALIQKAMANVLKGRTSFVIAHRLSTIVNADKIVVMDSGEIVEFGRHEELLAKPDGRYKDLYEQQFAGIADVDATDPKSKVTAG
ncbi:MAG: ABC transporter ATP-binding protein [Candidatus Latescibacterota bacterium]|nr:ABC transporter ATP-binding protein [Candidatus Latescibacterota bacterium]